MEQAKEILVSIIIPIYQAKDTLERCVLSCLDQKTVTPSEYEIILSDDGSTDGSGQICDRFSKEYANISVIHNKNHGVSCARNIALERATGRYVTFVDADDTLSQDFLENVLKYAGEGMVVIDENTALGNSTCSGYQYIDSSILPGNTHVWGKLFLRKTLEDEHIRFPEDLTIGEDLHFLIDLCLSQGKKRSIKTIDFNDYNYIENSEGAMKSAFKPSYLDEITCWERAENKLLPVRDKLSHYSFVTLGASRVMTSLLVIGKIALIDDDKKDADLAGLAMDRAQDAIRHSLKTRGVFAALSAGHQIKVIVLGISRDLYLKLYSRHKNRK